MEWKCLESVMPQCDVARCPGPVSLIIYPLSDEMNQQILLLFRTSTVFLRPVVLNLSLTFSHFF